MYCGHCGVAVGDDDVFCRACGARFADEPAVTSFAPPPLPTTLAGLAGGAASGTAGATASPTAPPTELLPFVPTPRPPANDKRPLLIGAAFALVVLAGIGAFFLLRKDDDSSTTPLPSVLSVALPTSTVLPPVATTAAPTTALPAAPSTTGRPTTVPASTIVATTVAPTVAPTAAPTTSPPADGTVAPSEATIPGATVGPVDTAAPPGAPGAPTVGAVAASAVRQGSFDSCGAATSYEPGNLLDGRLDTAWMAQGDGVGDTITFTLDAPSQVTTVGLVPGYAKVDPCTGSDRFTDLRRITKVRWTFDGGASIVQSTDPSNPAMQTITLSTPATTSTVRLTVLATVAPGNPGLNYTPISEITLS